MIIQEVNCPLKNEEETNRLSIYLYLMLQGFCFQLWRVPGKGFLKSLILGANLNVLKAALAPGALLSVNLCWNLWSERNSPELIDLVFFEWRWPTHILCTEVRHRHSDSGGLSPQLVAGPFWENGLWPTSGWLALSSSNSSCPNHNFFFSLLPFTSSFQTAFRLGSPFLVMFHQAPCYPNKKPREPLDTPPSFTSCTRSVTRLKHLPNTS